jgi:predicted RND superfamily exporter protein
MQISSFLAAAVRRRPRLLLAVSVLLTLAALVPALHFRIETDLAALLPEGAPGADDYRLFLRTFGGFEKVFVIVRSPGRGPGDPAPLIAAAERLAEILAHSPEVAEARSGLTAEDERFFLTYVAPRLPLLVHEEGWKADLRRRLDPAAIHARVAEMRQALRSPAGPVVASFFAADPLGLSGGLLGAAAPTLPIDPLTGSFVSRRGDAALVILTPARAEIDPAGGRALLAELGRAYGEVRRSAAVPLDFQAAGGPLYAAQDEALLRGDLTRTATASALGVTVLLLLGFGGAFIPLIILAAVVAGLVWTVAAAALGLGGITVVAVGFAAALPGMGVDYGIHGGARFRRLRLAGADAATALASTFRDPGPGIVASTLTTAAGLGALGLAHFRPLRELGLVLAIGVLVTLATTVALGAAALAAFPRRSAVSAPPRLWQRFGQPGLERGVGFAARRPLAVLAVAALLTAVSAWGISRLTFVTDLRSLRPASHPSAAAERLLVDDFAVGLDTMTVVAPGRTLGEALDKAAAARPLLASRLGSGAEITSPADWLIQGRRLERRLRELRDLPLARAADDFERELAAAGFRPQPFAPALAALRAMGRGEDPNPPRPETWPRWMSELVRVGPAGAAAAVHVRVPLGARASAGGLARDLRRISPDLALASVPRVGAELRGLAIQDLVRASVLALALVVAVVLVSLRRRLGDTLLTGLPLALGCLWTFGLWGACGGHVDLLAVSALPVLFGNGIDLGLYAVHGGRARPEAGIRGTIVESGLAMILIALTTAVGFGSLGSSRVPGIQNAGTLVALGVVACLIATFLVLPALESLVRSRKVGAQKARP